MDYLQVLIFAVVEGVTEFLPVSSTGHLVLTAKFLGVPQTEFVKSFEIIIQLGAMLSVVFLYWNTIWGNKKVWKPVIAAFIPTAVVGLAFYSIIKNYLLGNEMVTVVALLLGGIIMIVVEKFFVKEQGDKGIKKIENISTKNAIIIGLSQSVSIIPGVSRAAATIIGALLLGTSRKTAVEFSFLLAVPTMTAAVGLDLIRSSFSFTPSEWGLLAVGFVGSFIVAGFAVKFFIKFIQHHTFIPFGIYRIILAILFLLIIN
jgi:undecaprenyl-diphosphatase